MILKIRHFALVQWFAQLLQFAIARSRLGFPGLWNDFQLRAQAASSQQSKQPLAAHQHEHGQGSVVWRVDQSPARPRVSWRSSPYANAMTVARAACAASGILQPKDQSMTRGSPTSAGIPGNRPQLCTLTNQVRVLLALLTSLAELLPERFALVYSTSRRSLGTSMSSRCLGQSIAITPRNPWTSASSRERLIPSALPQRS